MKKLIEEITKLSTDGKAALAVLGREAILAACECVQVAAMAYKATLGYSGGTNDEY